MRQRRDGGVATTRGAGAGVSSSSSSGSGGKSRKGNKDVGRERKPRACRTDNSSRMHNLTAVRMANIIKQLNNKRGSTMESIRSKLIRSGFKTNTCLVRTALDRAVKSGLLREIREERFSLPSQRSSSNVNSTISASSRSSVKTAKKVPSKALQPHRKMSECSSPRNARRRQRRPPQGRRLASSETVDDDDDEGRDVHDDDDTGVGEGDVEAESNGSMAKNQTGSRMSVAEPVAGCDAVMVFGTH